MRTLATRDARDALGAIVRAYIERGAQSDAESDRYRPGIVHASTIGAPLRQAVMAYHAERYPPATLSAQARRVFEVGHQRHAALRAALRHAGWRVPVEDEEEAPWFIGLGPYPWRRAEDAEPEPLGWYIRGHADALIEDVFVQGIGRVPRAVLEIKTMSDFAFDRFRAGQLDAKYHAQIQINMAGLKAPWALVIAERKHTQALHASWYPGQPESQGALVRHAQAIAEGVSSGTDPLDVEACGATAPDDYGVGRADALKWGCSYCRHWQHCYPGHVAVLRPGGKKNTVPAHAVKPKDLVIGLGRGVRPAPDWTMTSEDAE